MNQYSIVAPKSSLESPIARKILAGIGDRNTFFIFPTQVSANSWVKAIVRNPGISSVEKDRFLGWDSFVELITKKNIPSDRMKSDIHARLLWALRTLEEQRESPFLRRLAKPGLAPSLSLATNLAKMAPALRDIAGALRRGELPREAFGQEEELDDYLALAGKYAIFLEENGLYEQMHLGPGIALEGHYIIFEPLLIPGYDKFSDSLKATCSVEEYPDDEQRSREPGPDIKVYKYQSFSQELQSVLSACVSLLDRGLEPENIAISAPILTPEFQAHMRRIADQHGLPLVFHSGEPLSASPFGKLLLSLSQAEEEGFSLRALRKLLDLGPFGWKDAGTARRLIRIAELYHIPEFSVDRQYMSALWKKTFALCPKADRALRDFYATLKKAAYAISGAASFPALGRALYDFRDTFLDESSLPLAAVEKLERIFEELQMLDIWQARIYAPALPANPFRILLLILDSTAYSPVETVNAISVYPYHIGMLLASDVHFVLDASQESTKPALAHFSDLPDELRFLASETTDISSALLASFNAVNAVYCHAERGLSGYSVLHPYFSFAGAKVERMESRDIPLSPDAIELRSWLGAKAEFMPTILPKAKKEAALGTFAPGVGCPALPPPFFAAIDRPLPGRKALDSALLQRLPACSADPLIKISPSRLKNFSLCPFKWLLSCIPDVDKGPSAVLDLAEGSLTHALIRVLLMEIADRDGAVVPDRIEDYLRWLDELLAPCLDSILRQTGPSVEIAMLSAFPKIRDRIARLLVFETEFKALGWNIGEFESNHSKSYEVLGLVIEGRADRIAERSATGDDRGQDEKLYAIIDYKKKATPKKKDFLVGEDGKIHDFQIAGYAEMLEGEGKNVDLAMYWSIEDCKSSTVFGQGGARSGWEDFGRERKAFAAAMESTARTMHEGKFMAITPSIEGCTSCPIRPICRAHFSSERL